MTTTVCEHGQLARQCRVCELSAERDEAQLRACQIEDLLHWQNDETRIALARAAEAEAALATALAEVEDLKRGKETP